MKPRLHCATGVCRPSDLSCTSFHARLKCSSSETLVGARQVGHLSVAAIFALQPRPHPHLPPLQLQPQPQVCCHLLLPHPLLLLEHALETVNTVSGGAQRPSHGTLRRSTFLCRNRGTSCAHLLLCTSCTSSDTRSAIARMPPDANHHRLCPTPRSDTLDSNILLSCNRGI